MVDTHDLQQVVVVTGDLTMDWNLARTRRSDGGGAAWNADDCARAYWQRGGAALLADLIEATARQLRQSGLADYEVRQMDAPRKPVRPGDDRYHHSYAMWSSYRYGPKSHQAAESAWRVEEFLGLDRSTSDGAPGAVDRKRVANDTTEASLVVLDDADLGFRDHSELWPKAITTGGRRPWVLLKMARPVAQGDLWEHLHEHHADRLIVVMTINDLRLTEVQISRELSWERTAQDLAWELVNNPRVNALSRCAHTVVSFDTAGAFLLSRSQAEAKAGGGRDAPKCVLFFDPKVIEGMWGQAHPGGMIGYTSCLAAGIVRQLMLSTAEPDMKRGIQSGLAAMRKLHLEGYGVRGSTAPQARLAFPVKLIADELARDGSPFAESEVQDPLRFLTQPAAATEKAPEAGFWTILEDRCTDTLTQVAQQIVLEGAEAALQGVPLGQFGNLLTVDRREIESFRSIGALIREYCHQNRPSRPLSIAVFGAPGSGKSFGIVEVARSLSLPAPVEKLTFNLSQWNDPVQLLDALHRVRDAGLAGKIPLVFWDEFDTALNGQPLGWLAYFLAPMQDGAFQQGQITHAIGRAIFVFAGGTKERAEDFVRGPDDRQFRDAKGPDFVSRLKGYVNILGPNPRGGQANADPYYIIRRAILLRSILYRDAHHLFERSEKGGTEALGIDRGVLRALLQTRKYKHGVRSMESLIAMSLLAGKRRFERSCLPAAGQLDLHVDAQEFQSLVQQIELEGALLERLAGAAHGVFCAGKERDGWKYGPEKSEEKRTHPLLIPYEELPEIYKESNRVTVRNIPRKLAAAGYVMIPSRSNEPPIEFPGDDLEKLARFEHELWMADRLAAGFTLGEPTPDCPRRNENLVEWEQVADDIKQIDRDLIRGIPQILAKAGYTIVKLKEAGKEAPRAAELGK